MLNTDARCMRSANGPDRARPSDRDSSHTATNPVKDGLVDKVHHWPGVNGLGALLAGRPLRAERPWHFYRREGVMPEVVEMRLAIPAELGPEAEVIAELRQRVAAAEVSIATERQRAGRKVYGRRAVLQQAWWGRPSSGEPRRNLRPRVAARSKWARIEALRCAATRTSSWTTGPRVRRGEPAPRSRSRPGRTGCAGTRRC